jgi:hypothetical protein
MKVTMKLMEKMCLDYSSRWNKKMLWDSYCLVNDAWLNGYYTGCTNAPYGEELVEVEIGSNQIGQGLPPFTAEQFKTEMQKVYGCEDFRVDIKDGLVSFQGTFRINND